MARHAIGHDEPLNLDIQSILDPALDRQLAARCPKFKELEGLRACVETRENRAAATWRLSGRVMVILSAPDPAGLRAAATQIDLAGLAEFAAALPPPE